MSVQRSQTRIVNRAAALLGSTERIEHINDGSALAILAKALWDEALDLALVSGTWNCAIKRMRLNAATDAPLFGYERAFTLPSDCLRWLPWAQNDPDYFEGEEEGGRILTNAEAPLPIRFIFRQADLTKWSPQLAEAMAKTLAGEMAYAKTADAGVSEMFEDRAEKARRNARRIEGLSTGKRARRVRSGWLDARR